MTLLLRPTTGLCLLLLCACASSRPPPVGSRSQTILAAVNPDPSTYGELVYTGDVFGLKGETTTQRFRYERRVKEANGTVTSTNFTADVAGQIAVIETAEHPPPNLR